MKLKPNSVIRLYSTALVGNNLPDYYLGRTSNSTRADFQNGFDSTFDLIQIKGNGFISFNITDVRAVKFGTGSISLVLPVGAEKIIDKNLLRCICDDGTHYFNIEAINSLNDNAQNPSCEVFCNENFYYTYLYEIQLGLEKTYATFARRHVHIFEEDTTDYKVISGVEGSLSSNFNTFITKQRDFNAYSILWLYVTFDEDVTFDTLYNGVSKEKQYADFMTMDSYGQNRRVFAIPYGMFINGHIEMFSESSNYISKVKVIYSSGSFQSFNPNFALTPGAFGVYVIDAFVTNIKPSFKVDVDIANKTLILYDVARCSPKTADGKALMKGYCYPSFASTLDGSNMNVPFSFSETFANFKTTYEEQRNFNVAIYKDPALFLFPYFRIFTLNGELQYTPIKTGETLKCTITSYYRTLNAEIKGMINDTNIFYLNFWENANSFYIIDKDTVLTFYRNNGNQYKTKMTTRRINDALGVAQSAVATAAGVAGLEGNVTKTYTNVPLRNAKGQYTGQTKRMLSGTSTDPISVSQIVGASSGGVGNILSGAVDFVSSFFEEDALKNDLANAQNEYQNVDSQTYPSCQCMVFMENSPDISSPEYLNAVLDLYYFGYARKDYGIIGENTRQYYDFKKCGTIYGTIVSNQFASSAIISALQNGTTFWHIDFFNEIEDNSLVSQIVTTANKYGLANFDSNI